MTSAPMVQSANGVRGKRGREARDCLSLKWISQNAQMLLKQRVSTCKLIFLAWGTDRSDSASLPLMVCFKKDKPLQWVSDLVRVYEHSQSAAVSLLRHFITRRGSHKLECDTLIPWTTHMENYSHEAFKSIKLSTWGLESIENVPAGNEKRFFCIMILDSLTCLCTEGKYPS